MKLTRVSRPPGPLTPDETVEWIMIKGHKIRAYHDADEQYYEHDETVDVWYRLDSDEKT